MNSCDFPKKRIVTYFKIPVFNTMWYARKTDKQTSGAKESLETDPCMYGHMIYDRCGISKQWEKNELFN